MTTLETLTDTTMFDIYQVNQPALVAAIADLVKAGQTPTQIEQAMIAKFGRNQTTRNVRHIAEYLVRQP